MTLKAAAPEDVPVIQQLAKSIWYDHYIHIISKEQIAYMLEKMYSAESLLHQMLDQQHEFFLIQDDSENIGFISIKRNDSEVFLNKFYILTNKQNKGVGTQAFNLLREIAEPYETIRLTVNRQNYKSINFYFKNGFKIEKVEDFKIGNGYEMNDFIMSYSKTGNTFLLNEYASANN